MNEFTQSQRDTILSIRQAFGNNKNMWEFLRLYCWLIGWWEER